MKPIANSAAPSMPNSSSGFCPKRSSNQTDEHVEHADGNASEAELRLAGVPRVQRHRDLRDREPLRGGEHDHVAVPVGAVRQRVHDLAAVGLDVVEVAARGTWNSARLSPL